MRELTQNVSRLYYKLNCFNHKQKFHKLVNTNRARACSRALLRPDLARPARDGRIGVRPLYFNFLHDVGVLTSDCSCDNLLQDLGVEGRDCFLLDRGVEDLDCFLLDSGVEG